MDKVLLFVRFTLWIVRTALTDLRLSVGTETSKDFDDRRRDTISSLSANPWSEQFTEILFPNVAIWYIYRERERKREKVSKVSSHDWVRADTRYLRDGKKKGGFPHCEIYSSMKLTSYGTKKKFIQLSLSSIQCIFAWTQRESVEWRSLLLAPQEQ